MLLGGGSSGSSIWTRGGGDLLVNAVGKRQLSLLDTVAVSTPPEPVLHVCLDLIFLFQVLLLLFSVVVLLHGGQAAGFLVVDAGDQSGYGNISALMVAILLSQNAGV